MKINRKRKKIKCCGKNLEQTLYMKKIDKRLNEIKSVKENFKFVNEISHPFVVLHLALH